MRRLRQPFLVVTGLMLLAVTSSVLGQAQYGSWPVQAQTKNIPAGTVFNPGSQLLYIADTGINVRKELGAALTGKNAAGDTVTLTSLLSATATNAVDKTNPFGVGGSKGIYNTDRTLDATKIFQSFVSVTNTHPTQAVTVHFRYFNDVCEDVLDFLVLLTCEDTLIFDPFNFNIPGTTFNTRTRIFGPAVGLFTPINISQFASGRFLIFATAAGTSTDADDDAEIIFPREFRGSFTTGDKCVNLRWTGTSSDPTAPPGFGTSTGLVASNLHVFNASAVSFNYLIGHFTTAVPKGFFTGPGISEQDKFLAYGVNAFTRPAVDLALDALTGNTSGVTGRGDGDGPHASDFKILTGSEPVLQAGQVSLVVTNTLYLRNEVHGGDTRVDSGPVSRSLFGALGWTSLHDTSPENQLVHFLSIVDDYNGSRHSGDTAVGGFKDRSYNLNGAETVYVLQLFNNDEVIFDVVAGTPINISPPPFEAPTAILKITVDCLRVWVTAVKTTATSIDDFQISDLSKITAGALDHVRKTVTVTTDASQGWIRFVRDNTEGGTESKQSSTVQDNTSVASFVTIGLVVLKFEGFGASWWLPAAASNLAVSTTGDPTP